MESEVHKRDSRAHVFATIVCNLAPFAILLIIVLTVFYLTWQGGPTERSRAKLEKLPGRLIGLSLHAVEREFGESSELNHSSGERSIFLDKYDIPWEHPYLRFSIDKNGTVTEAEVVIEYF